MTAGLGRQALSSVVATVQMQRGRYFSRTHGRMISVVVGPAPLPPSSRSANRISKSGLALNKFGPSDAACRAVHKRRTTTQHNTAQLQTPPALPPALTSTSMTLFAALFTALFIARVSAQQPGQIGRGGVPAWANPDFVACGSPSDTCGPFFAEAAEGSSNNKYLEIYNPTNESLDRARSPCAAWPAPIA